jgi:hypothetical protein
MKWLIIPLVLLTGCTRTLYVDRPVEHRVEVSRPCLESSDIPRPPAYAMSQLSPGVSDGGIVLAMRQEIAERADYPGVLQGLLGGCVR